MWPLWRGYGRCRCRCVEVALVERLKLEWIFGLSARNKNVAVEERRRGSTELSKSTNWRKSIDFNGYTFETDRQLTWIDFTWLQITAEVTTQDDIFAQGSILEIVKWFLYSGLYAIGLCCITTYSYIVYLIHMQYRYGILYSFLAFQMRQTKMETI